MLIENEKVQIYSNYKRKNKWLGIIDYRSLVLIIIYVFVVVSILRIVPLKLEYLIYVFIFLVIPVISILLINLGNDSAIDMLLIMLKFTFNNAIFVKREYVVNLKNQMYVKKLL